VPGTCTSTATSTLRLLPAHWRPELFHLSILAPSIQSNKNNFTRFLYLQRENSPQPYTDVNKASVNFYTDHTRGSLAKVLQKIADAGINLSKLQSMPIPEREWQYSFYAIWSLKIVTVSSGCCRG
jgi:prephenate dehydratase